MMVYIVLAVRRDYGEYREDIEGVHSTPESATDHARNIIEFRKQEVLVLGYKIDGGRQSRTVFQLDGIEEFVWSNGTRTKESSQ